MQVFGLQHQQAAAALADQAAQCQIQQQQRQQIATLNGHHQQQQQHAQGTLLTNGKHQQQQRWRWAIDIGACPGGWTTYLSDCCGCNVIAIDPADLHPDVTARPGVHQIKARAQDASQQIDQLLQGQQVRGCAGGDWTSFTFCCI